MSDHPLPARKSVRQIVIEEVFPDPDQADFPDLDAAIESALPLLAALINPGTDGDRLNADREEAAA